MRVTILPKGGNNDNNAACLGGWVAGSQWFPTDRNGRSKRFHSRHDGTNLTFGGIHSIDYLRNSMAPGLRRKFCNKQRHYKDTGTRITKAPQGLGGV
jgi:hypothetical protein